MKYTNILPKVAEGATQTLKGIEDCSFNAATCKKPTMKVVKYLLYIFVFLYVQSNNVNCADPSGRAVQGVGLRPFTCWDRGFESHRGHVC
jgi:hypothetical protein